VGTYFQDKAACGGEAAEGGYVNSTEIRRRQSRQYYGVGRTWQVLSLSGQCFFAVMRAVTLFCRVKEAVRRCRWLRIVVVCNISLYRCLLAYTEKFSFYNFARPDKVRVVACGL
jgi:hypothetical protein